jgi:hypothetical protein
MASSLKAIPTAALGLGSTRRSSWPVAGYPVPAETYARNRPLTFGEVSSWRDLICLMGVMVDLYCASYETAPAAVTLGH